MLPGLDNYFRCNFRESLILSEVGDNADLSTFQEFTSDPLKLLIHYAMTTKGVDSIGHCSTYCQNLPVLIHFFAEHQEQILHLALSPRSWTLGYFSISFSIT